MRVESRSGTMTLARNTGRSAKLQDKADYDAQPVATAAVTAIASSATSKQLVPANVVRKGLTLVNTDANDAYVKFGPIASLTSFTVRVRGNSKALYEMPAPIYTGRIDVIWSAAGGGGHMVVTES
jgi:hypothetical protein